MFEVVFLMIAISFLMVAFQSAVAMTSASPTVRRIANRVSYGSLCRSPSLNRVGGAVSRSAAGLGAAELHQSGHYERA